MITPFLNRRVSVLVAAIFSVGIFFIFGLPPAHAAPLLWSTAESISLTSPVTIFTIVAGSVADMLQVNATSVRVTLSSTTIGSFTLTSSAVGFSVATSSSGGTVAMSCTSGTASTTITQSTGSTGYTIAPTASPCLYISNVVASTTPTTATITWTTDNAASSEVDYGTTTAYGSAATSSVLTTSHSVALSGLTPGALYDFQVKSVDAQSEVALSANQTFNAVTDGTPPTVSFATPISGTSLTGTVTVSANAADNVAVASVQFMLDGANFGSAVTTPPYQTSWDTTATTNGSHTLTAIALDTSGNTASSTIIVTVENASPASTPSVSSGGGGSSYSLSIDNGAGTTATSSVTLSLYGTAAYTMEISNTPTFAGATWLPYVATMPWTIAPYPGPETVYAQFKAISGTIVGSTEASIDLISTGLSSSTSLSSQPSSPLSLFDQLKVLQSELAVLLAEANITITPSTTSFVFTHSLSFGMTSSDARRLQTFLAQDLALYPEGKVTGYFGALTLKAVERFQKKYGIANPGNLGYGTVGPLTRTKLNALIKQDLGP